MTEEKEELLKKIKNTYCRLKPSSIEGIGVFAIRDIPADIDPYLTEDRKWIEFNISELRDLDGEILRMLDDFFVIEADQSVYVPAGALNGLDISFYMNNSANPNVATIDEGETFRTLRPVKKGEELTINYSTFDHKYKN